MRAAAQYRRHVAVPDLRRLISDLVAKVAPFDAREAADQADMLDWVASGQQLFRTAKPATPPKHLVVYFVPVDVAGGCLLLGDHRKSGLWLPPGGHVEDGEDPRQAVLREAYEELGITAKFHPGLGEEGEGPFFLTVTPTNDATSHLDVDLWFVLNLNRETRLTPDPREFNGVRWFALGEQRDWPADRYDPEMGRFAAKLRSVLGSGRE
jgi:8-oxo-dGTP diphosphatase